MKTLIKWLMPSAKTLSGMAAKGIADAVNDSGKTDAIAKYSQMLKTASASIAYVNNMLVDGKIDPTETEKIAALLEAPVASLMEML